MMRGTQADMTGCQGLTQSHDGREYFLVKACFAALMFALHRPELRHQPHGQLEQSILHLSERQSHRLFTSGRRE